MENSLPDSTDFQDLVERARQGNEDAMAELVRQYEPDVRIVARVRLGTALRPYVDSVDLVQSVHRSLLIALQDNRFDISTPENLVGLAVTMVRRKAARQWRKLKRQQRLSGVVAADDADLPALLANREADRDDPARIAALKDQAEQILAGLASEDREFLELRMQGLSTAEAARAMGLNSDVQRVRLSRLRKKLIAGGLTADWL